MFTAAQIKEAHSKVRSGADFPAYIQELVSLGVKAYTSFVTDGQTDYYGAGNYTTSTPAKYAAQPIAENSDAAGFKADLKAHQQGHTDYPTFCSDCARSGIEKWVVDMDRMTCSYYDKKGTEMLVENIPTL